MKTILVVEDLDALFGQGAQGSGVGELLKPLLSRSDWKGILARLGPPRPGLAPASEFTRIEEQFSRRDEVVGLHALGAPGEPDCLETLAACSLQATLAGYSLWWCHGENGTSGGFAHRNLPGAPFLTKMLTYSPAG